MQRESIIGLAVMVTLAVLAPRAPVDEQSEAAIVVPDAGEGVALHEATHTDADGDPCPILYKHRHGEDNAAVLAVDVTI